jgi:hypothetical protein
MKRAFPRVRRRFGAALTTIVLVNGANVAEGQVDVHTSHLLGKVDFPISCSARAQSEFDRAIALLHHMTYPLATEAFQQVARTDPQFRDPPGLPFRSTISRSGCPTISTVASVEPSSITFSSPVTHCGPIDRPERLPSRLAVRGAGAPDTPVGSGVYSARRPK